MTRNRYHFVGKCRIGQLVTELSRDIEAALERAHELEDFLRRHAGAEGYSAALYLGERRVWGSEVPGEVGTPKRGA